jgi:hypothetical protein
MNIETKRTKFQAEFKSRLSFLMNQGVYITDTPVAETFREISLILPSNSSIVITLRDPSSWVKSRLGYGHSLICKEEFWDNAQLLHPFDYIGCLSINNFDNLKSFTSLYHYSRILNFSQHNVKIPQQMSDFPPIITSRVQKLEEAYIKMNTINLLLSGNRTILPICLWDYSSSNYTRLNMVENVKSFFNEKSLNITETDLVYNKCIKSYPHPPKMKIKVTEACRKQGYSNSNNS